MDITALIISIAAFVFTLIQYFRDGSRQKKEATLVAYNELQNEVFTQLNLIFVSYPKNELYSLGAGDEDWENITVYLSKLERFSVGINTGIYSINILNRLGGGYIIRIFEELMPIIRQKRNDNKCEGLHYDELEKTVNTLKKMRAH